MTAVEAILLAGLLLVTGAVTTYEPPDTAPFLNPLSWSMYADNATIRVDMLPVSGSTDTGRFEIFLPVSPPYNSGASVTFNMFMPDREVGQYGMRAVQVSPNSYLGEATFAIPGNWRFEVSVDAGGRTLRGGHDLTVPGLPLEEDLRAYLSLRAVTFTSSNTINFFIGVSLVMTFGWLLWQSRTGKIPLWMTIGGTGGMALGIYLALSIMLVKTYPSTYWRNPQPFTAEVISRGWSGFADACAECHGSTGGGDGPWAIEHRGSIPDLGSPHMDVHTDGEIYWWITRGIPSLDMPALDEALTVDQRWEVINYIRSLRHGVPGGG